MTNHRPGWLDWLFRLAPGNTDNPDHYNCPTYTPPTESEDAVLHSKKFIVDSISRRIEDERRRTARAQLSFLLLSVIIFFVAAFEFANITMNYNPTKILDLVGQSETNSPSINLWSLGFVFVAVRITVVGVLLTLAVTYTRIYRESQANIRFWESEKAVIVIGLMSLSEAKALRPDSGVLNDILLACVNMPRIPYMDPAERTGFAIPGPSAAKEIAKPAGEFLTALAGILKRHSEPDTPRTS